MIRLAAFLVSLYLNSSRYDSSLASRSFVVNLLQCLHHHTRHNRCEPEPAERSEHSHARLTDPRLGSDDFTSHSNQEQCRELVEFERRVCRRLRAPCSTPIPYLIQTNFKQYLPDSAHMSRMSYNALPLRETGDPCWPNTNSSLLWSGAQWSDSCDRGRCRRLCYKWLLRIRS